MIERIDAARTRVVRLSALLDKPHAVEPSATEPAVSAPDPRELLEQERQRLLEAATQAGYEAGLQRAETELLKAVSEAELKVEAANAAERERLRAAQAQLQDLLQLIPQALADLDTKVEDVAVETAFAAVLRVIGQAAADGSLMRDICRQALAEYVQRPVLLRVAREQASAVADLAEGDAIRVVGDSRFSAGECRLETHKGLYDTSLEVRLDALKQAFLRSLREAPR